MLLLAIPYSCPSFSSHLISLAHKVIQRLERLSDYELFNLIIVWGIQISINLHQTPDKHKKSFQSIYCERKVNLFYTKEH